MLENSEAQSHILNPANTQFEKDYAEMKRNKIEMGMAKAHSRVDRLLQNIKNSNIRMKRDEPSIGGNELLLDDMI